MIVMKFGGTSVEDAACIERVVEIVRSRLGRNPVVVVSAMGKTTRRLLDAAEASAAGDSKTTLRAVAALKADHIGEVHRLFRETESNETLALIERYFDELTKLLEGLAILGEVPPRGLDKILAYGELLSSAILAGALKGRGIKADLLDAREIIKTDDRYGGASPIFDLTNACVSGTVEPLIASGKVPVLQGFIGSARDGATTTLGFEGSDYTAAIVAAAISADDVEIWKDVSGLMTADPSVFPEARTVKRCSYREAAELTYFGAKVLHQKAIYPAAEKGIPVHIYNSRDALSPGTEITFDPGPCTNLVKSIAYKRPVTVIRLQAELTGAGGNAAGDDMLKSALDVLAIKRINRLVTAASESGLVVVVDSASFAGDRRLYVEERLSRLGTLSIEEGRAIISLVGDGIGESGRLPFEWFSLLPEKRAGLILHGQSARTVNVVVDAGDVEETIAHLHQGLFEEVDERIFC